MCADTGDVFKWRRGAGAGGTTDEESVDIVARLHPYEELFGEAMAMAVRFTEDRERREREAAAASRARADRPGRWFARRAG